jgi:Apea-like HEPN
MLETYYSSGVAVTKAIGDFLGTTVSVKWASGQLSIDLGGGFHLLSKNHPHSVSYRTEQKNMGYDAKRTSLILLDYGDEVKNEFYDDPFQKFLRLGLSISVLKPHKILPVGFAVLHQTGEDTSFYRPRNYLSSDDYRTLSFENRKMSLKDVRSALVTYSVADSILSKSVNSKLNDALSYYIDYLKASDPKIELVLLTMILETLFIEDDSSAELQTKLMTRLSRFLLPKAASKESRYKLSEFVKNIYDIRSSVLHGSEYQKILAKRAKTANTTPQQYLSSHISELDAVVMEVLNRIFKTQEYFQLMNRYPRRGDDRDIKKMYQTLMLG